MSNSNPEPRGKSVNAFLFWGIAIAAVAGVFAIVWFGIPGPDNVHRITAPSGTQALDIGELCGDFTCDRVIIHETGVGSETPVRFGCNFSVESSHPIFQNVIVAWTGDESAAVLIFTGDAGQETVVALDFQKDCVITDS